jgi:hypothetical protein
VQLGQGGLLGGQVVGDLGGPGGLGEVGRGDPDRAYQAAVQVAQHVTLVAVHQVAAALAAVAHLRIFHADASVGGHALAKRRRQVGGQLHVLVDDLPGGLQRVLGCRGSQPVVGHQPLHLLQEAQHHPKCLVTGGRVVPVAVQRRLDTGPAKGWHARLGRHRRHPLGPRQPPPLLPAPHNGLASNAARNARSPNPPLALASATVCSTSRRSSPAAISRARKPTSVPLENGARSASRQSNTSCQRRSITVASITSSSLAPV